MEIGVCVKRVPMVGGKIVLTPDEQEVDTRLSGFTISPHEECAVEEAVQITERLGGTVSVLTLGPPEAADQLREALALGAKRAVLLETDGREWGPIATAKAIVAEVRRHAADGPGYDLLLCGNEAADTGDYQVGIRVACALGWPCVTGIKSLEITEIDGSGLGPVTEERGPEPPGGSGPSGSGVSPGNTVPPRASIATARARREYRGGEEAFEFGLPAVICVKEGINRSSGTNRNGATMGSASESSGCPRPSASRPPCWAPGPMGFPRSSACSRSGACCHDRAMPGRTRCRRACRRVAAGADVRRNAGGGRAGAGRGRPVRGHGSGSR